ncbi:MAG: HAD family hydrolase [Tepidiformaceae bacterium]
MPIRAILFDIGDTLWHDAQRIPMSEFRRLGAERAAEFLSSIGRSDLDPDGVAPLAWDALVAAIAHAQSGDLIEPDYPEAVRRVLAEAGIALSRDETARLLEAVYVSGREAGKLPYPDARPVLEELQRRGFRLATITNRAFGGERFRADMRDAGLDIAWEVEAVSCELGYLKPHPRIFEWTLDQLALSPAELLMVGNSLAQDVAGAQRHGITTAWRRCKPDAKGITPDYTIDELTGLLDLPPLRGCG